MSAMMTTTMLGMKDLQHLNMPKITRHKIKECKKATLEE
jgi:methanogenic corrinoid protein MtbC1